MRAAAALWLALTLLAGAAGARAQTASPIAFDPNNAALGTALVVAADATQLSSGGAVADSLAIGLPRGARVDTAARSVLCDHGQAARGTCPLESRIGFGRFVVALDGYVPGGRTELTWSLDAYLGEPAKRGDVASVVLSGTLLGADSVAALLEPSLGTTLPRTATTIGRLVRQNFIRRYRIRTPSGYEVRRIRDHRLVGHELLRTPRTCTGSWPYRLTVGFPGGVQRNTGRLPCAKALSVGA
jgi:hypothetical protein